MLFGKFWGRVERGSTKMNHCISGRTEWRSDLSPPFALLEFTRTWRLPAVDGCVGFTREPFSRLLKKRFKRISGTGVLQVCRVEE